MSRVRRPSRGPQGWKIVIRSFAKECLVKDATAYALKFEVYPIYHNFCIANWMIPRGLNIFNSTLKSVILGLKESSRSIGKEEHQIYLGVRLNMKNSFVRKFNPRKLNLEDIN